MYLPLTDNEKKGKLKVVKFVSFLSPLTLLLYTLESIETFKNISIRCMYTVNFHRIQIVAQKHH